MRGVDVSAEEIASVRQFLDEAAIGALLPTDESARISVRVGDYLRVIAWYAAIKKSGDGSGRFVSRRREAERERNAKGAQV